MKEFILKLNKSFYYGWIIVLMSGIAFFMSAPGQTYSISVFINQYNKEFNYSSTLISSAYSLATTISGFLLIFMGKAVDKYGARRMMIIVGTMLALTAFYNSFVSSITMIFIGFFLLRYFGQGSMTLIPSTLVPQWFEKKRAFAISLSSIGNLLATMSIPVFNLWLITEVGWQNAWRTWSIILVVLFIPLVLLFVVNKPEDIGLTIDNDKQGNEQDIKIALEKMTKESFTLNEAIKTKEFWFAGIISMIPSMFTTGLTFHFFNIMDMRSISNDAAAVIIGLIAIPSFFMPVIARPVIDRYPVKNIFFVTLTMMLISMGYLMWGVNNGLTAIIFILFYGSAIAVQSVSLNVLWPDYFGRKYLGSIRGSATVFMVLGSALGPLPFGVVYDLTNKYNLAITGMMIFTFITIIMALSINKPEKKSDI